MATILDVPQPDDVDLQFIDAGCGTTPSETRFYQYTEIRHVGAVDGNQGLFSTKKILNNGIIKAEFYTEQPGFGAAVGFGLCEINDGCPYTNFDYCWFRQFGPVASTAAVTENGGGVTQAPTQYPPSPTFCVGLEIRVVNGIVTFWEGSTLVRTAFVSALGKNLHVQVVLPWVNDLITIRRLEGFF